MTAILGTHRVLQFYARSATEARAQAATEGTILSLVEIPGSMSHDREGYSTFLFHVEVYTLEPEVL